MRTPKPEYLNLTKEFLSSPVWKFGDGETRIIYVTMLCSADWDGFVVESASELSKLAQVDFNKTRGAIEFLVSGGHIRKQGLGWIITDFDKFRPD